ncbi:histidine kinase [Paenibacillus elgii]|uniref:histidine kinase n=1 Tax=Paenibacillus elgii TaxID=189691 RepID=A0A163UNC8_9BACL|nr:ATP-binding protein [Paenibacillus elgii]KZE73581.1 histidine kinase [Paenibacillus elgii]
MTSAHYRKLIMIGLIFSLSMALFVAIYAQTIPNGNSPPAKRGVLDLSGWDFHRKGMAVLDGEWEFYEGRLLEPADFERGPLAGGSYVSVPGTWKGEQKADGISKQGFGTYRLKVIVPASDDVFGLKIRSIRMSHRLFVNGKAEGGSGYPAADGAVHQPGNTPYTAFFHTNGREIEIVIQVANHVYANGGIVNSIQFGLHGDMTKLNSIQIGTDIASIFILGIFGAYHLSFYYLGRRDKTYLFSGLYLLTLLLQQTLIGEKIFMRLLPWVPFEIAYKLIDLSEFFGGIVIVLFFCSIDVRLLKSRTIGRMLAPIVVYMVAVVVLPYRMHSEIKPLFLMYMGVVSLFLLGRMIYLYTRKERDAANRKELTLFIGGIVSLTVFMIDSILYTVNMIPTDLLGKVGIACFIGFINMLLAVRFANAYEKTEALSHQLAVSNQLKDEFLAQTSHEIKTPLHGIMNMTAYLLDDEERNLSSKQKQNLWLIKDTSVKLSMLIHDLIDVSRLKHGELRLQLTVVDVRVVVQIVFDVLQFELLGKEVRLDNQVGSDVWVRADENRLRQVMYNLVHNAIKHTSQGTVRVRSSMLVGTVSIFVEDTGTGIAPDKHEAVFDYFEQPGQPLPQDGYTGMGVGLYISRKLVERMEGKIRVDWSEIGQGTRMMFTLPGVERIPAYREAAYTTAEPQRVASGSVPLDVRDQPGCTIMIVDDEASNIHLLLNVLKQHKYNVLTAFSAREALVKLEKHPQVDLVILDVMMPGMSGIELCRMLRNQYSILDLPILFATAKDTPQDIALGFGAGANDYITKPFVAETLIARIQTLIAMKTSIQEAIKSEHAFHQAQIKPHFLYNALSSVISFCYTNGEKAAYLLTMLSQYLRYILEMDRSALFVPLYRELELIQAYVEIEKARFGERFQFECDVDEVDHHHDIPSLCIQPFVENAIRHGLFEKEGFGTVALKIHKGEGYIRVVVEDDGIGIPDDLLYRMSKGEASDGGIAIANIRKRLDSIPGATLIISSEPGSGTKVTMYLPVDSVGSSGSDG